jgi:general secretion pathway protein K
MNRNAGAERGFVLLVVLSALGLLALVAATFTQVARMHIKAAAASVEGARAEALSDAGVHLAILVVVAAREQEAANRRFALNAVPVTCSFEEDGATLTIAVRDEAGKVDLNIASEALLRALVLGAGIDGGDAAVDTILDFRDADDDRRLSGAERAEYRAAGRPHGPKNGALVTVEELSGVLGLTQADVDLLRPFVTVYSGQAAVDPAVASGALIDVLSRGVQNSSSLFFKGAEGGGPRLMSARAPLPTS